MNLLQDAAEFLKLQRETYASEPVTYCRPGVQTFEILAAAGKSFFRVDDISGVTTRTRSLDFIVSCDAMPFEPERGDRVQYREKVFEVHAPDGEPCWRFAGNNCDSYRIHTHQVADDAFTFAHEGMEDCDG